MRKKVRSKAAASAGPAVAASDELAKIDGLLDGAVDDERLCERDSDSDAGGDKPEGAAAAGAIVAAEVDEYGEDGAGGEFAHPTSKLLAKVDSGDVDLTTLKQRIHDDTELLSNWRKAREMGTTESREEVFTRLVGNCSTYFGYSEELAQYFLQMFSPEKAIQFFEANEKQRPLTIRTNSLKTRRSSLMQSLTSRKVHLDTIGPWTSVGLKIYDSQVPVGATPEYLGGHYMIQSASSFIPCMALAPQQNETVLDMAAAPGGKTTYIGQLMRNTGTLFANDLRKERCKALVANVHRMGLTNVVVTNLDGRKLGGVLPKLDRVLLDAPCTGSGIIARDPGVKVKRGIRDFEESSRQQKELLTTAIDLVDANSKTGGYVVYSTCSVAVEENEAVIDYALRVRNVELVSFDSAVKFGVDGMTRYRERRFNPTLKQCKRYLPHVHNMDGFFVAKLRKTSNTIPERVRKDRSKGGDDVVWGEEKWTPGYMETVLAAPGEGEVAGAKPVGNKIERKKIKRQHQLAARKAEEARSKAASQAESGDAAPRVTEPEEEPKPQTVAKGKKRVGKALAPSEAPKKKAKKAKAGAEPSQKNEPEEPAKAAAAPDGAAQPVVKKKKRKKQA